MKTNKNVLQLGKVAEKTLGSGSWMLEGLREGSLKRKNAIQADVFALGKASEKTLGAIGRFIERGRPSEIQKGHKV